jgi:hypothetical protein
MGWQTDFWPCLRLAARRLRRRRSDIRTGELLIFRHGGGKYEMDTRYCALNFETNHEVTSLVQDTMERLLRRFERTIIIRAHIKQEMVPETNRNDLLRVSLQNYDAGWDLLSTRLKMNPRISFHVTEGFTLEDFFPLDNHWTPQGNEKFARMVNSLLQG